MSIINEFGKHLLSCMPEYFGGHLSSFIGRTECIEGEGRGTVGSLCSTYRSTVQKSILFVFHISGIILYEI